MSAAAASMPRHPAVPGSAPSAAHSRSVRCLSVVGSQSVGSSSRRSRCAAPTFAVKTPAVSRSLISYARAIEIVSAGLFSAIPNASNKSMQKWGSAPYPDAFSPLISFRTSLISAVAVWTVMTALSDSNTRCRGAPACGPSRPDRSGIAVRRKPGCRSGRGRESTHGCRACPRRYRSSPCSSYDA